MDETGLTAEQVMRAYSVGAFPMAMDRTGIGGVEWFSPDPRAVMPLEGFRVRRSLTKRVRNGPFTVTRDGAFEAVIEACRQPRPGPSGGETWISEPIKAVYTELHHMGLAHSVEAWNTRDGSHAPSLAGGLYGVALGGAFFGESMFSHHKDASQVCLVKLVEHLQARGFTLLDIQFITPHLAQFGAVEISREDYLHRLDQAIRLSVTF